MASTLESYPRRDATFRLRKGGVTVMDRYQGRVVTLDTFSSEIWLRIDGLTTVRDIAADLAHHLRQPPAQLEPRVVAMTGVLLSEGLIFLSAKPGPHPYHLAVATDRQDPDETAASKRACGWVDHYRSSPAGDV